MLRCSHPDPKFVCHGPSYAQKCSVYWCPNCGALRLWRDDLKTPFWKGAKTDLQPHPNSRTLHAMTESQFYSSGPIALDRVVRAATKGVSETTTDALAEHLDLSPTPSIRTILAASLRRLKWTPRQRVYKGSRTRVYHAP